MALTRRFLKALNISDEVIDEIITAHTDVTDDLKTQLKTAQGAQKQLETITAERDELQKKLNDTTQSDRISELEKQLSEYQTRETNAQKRTALTALLESAGIDKRGFARVLAATDLDGIELDGENIKDPEKLTEKLKTEWADLLVTDTTSTAKPATPHVNEASGITKEQIMNIKDKSERRMAIAQNLGLFNQTKGE